MMQEVDWARVKELFFVCRELAPDARATFLAEACGSDRALRAEVASLLASDETRLPLLDDALVPAVAEMLAERPEGVGPGRRIGRYRIERQLGRGGMGVVYLAARDDGHFRQQVALKLVSRGLTRASSFWRFERERQILADLVHPYIARLLDGGVTDGGRPYLVMEHVDGSPIDVDCDRCRRSVEDRLRLFLKVCEAVQHAHARLVVHCDLKPTNILITSDGEPRLIDFGVARLLDQREEEGAEPEAGVRRLTPEYASPEQLRGEPPTVASDVYALGVLLYGLLAGCLPFSGTRSASLEQAHAQRARDLPSPSAAVAMASGGAEHGTARAGADVASSRGCEARDLVRRLRGDLDSIVLRALAFRPQDRYASVERLKADVARHLAHRPVRARPPTLRYRMKKLARRRRMAVFAASVALSSMVLGTTVATWQARRARQAEAAARAEQRQAEAVSDVLESLVREIDPSRARSPLTLAEVLEDVEPRIHEELEHQPEVRGRLLYIWGTGYRHLGRYDRARSLMEEALALLPEDETRDVTGNRSLERARLLDSLGVVALRQNDVRRARRLLLGGIRLRGPMQDTNPLELAESFNSWGLLLRAEGQLEAAEWFVARALALRRKHDASDRELTISLGNLGVLYRDLGRVEQARVLLGQALEHQLRRFGPDHFLVGNSHLNLASVLASLPADQLASAENNAREALRIFRSSADGGHPRSALALHVLAEIMEKQGRLREARVFASEAVQLAEGLGEAHRLVVFLTRLAGVVRAQGDLETAAATFDRILRLHDRLSGVAASETLRILYHQLDVQRARGLASLALPRVNEYLRRPEVEKASLEVAYLQGQLGHALAEAGADGEARVLLERSIEGLRRVGRGDLIPEAEKALGALAERAAQGTR